MGKMLQIGDIWTVIIPAIVIFFARIGDVTLGTIRIIFLSRGVKKVAPLIGFVEVIVWLVAIGHVMQDITDISAYIAYGAGFATGTYLGMYIEEKLSVGKVYLRIMTKINVEKFVDFFRNEGIRYNLLDSESEEGKINMLFVITKRKNIPHIADNIKKFNEKALYTIEDLRLVSEGLVPKKTHQLLKEFWSKRLWRKGK